MSRKLLGGLSILAMLILSPAYVKAQASCQPGIAQDQGCIAEFDPFGNPVDSVIFDTFQFDGVGLVGIGTMLPAAKLDVVMPVGNTTASFTKGAAFGPTTFAAVQVKNLTTAGEALWLGQDSASNPFDVLKLVLPALSPANFLTCQQPDGTQKCHITNAGTFVGGSDFAEALPARAPRESYEPGDVLVMARDGAGIERTAERYSPRVAGVRSTRPGVLGADKNGESRVDANDVAVAIVGIVPTKVSAENGAIEVGDLLVTSSMLGHAMKGTDRARMPGAIVGKALQPLREGTGVIRVLVTLQ